jgi:hypothetical protein
MRIVVICVIDIEMRKRSIGHKEDIYLLLLYLRKQDPGLAAVAVDHHQRNS